MSTIGNARPSEAIARLENNWGWFVTLGAMLLIAGGIASVNLFASTLASILYISALMVFGGVMQLLHASKTEGWKRRLYYVISALFYLAAGAIAFYDPILSAVGISLFIGGFLIASGVFKIISGARDHAQGGWGWIVASGILTLAIGAILLAAWPGVSLWLLGALLTVDLIFQGWSYIAFGLALRERRKRSSQ